MEGLSQLPNLLTVYPMQLHRKINLLKIISSFIHFKILTGYVRNFLIGYTYALQHLLFMFYFEIFL